MFQRLFLTTCAIALSAGAAHADYTLHILHTNDLHSRIGPVSSSDSSCNAEQNAAGECFGGYARIVTKVNELREALAGENVIVLDAGDQYQGSLFYTTYKGDAEIEFANLVDYDVMALGNHEFDDGPEGALKLIDGAQFPVISGNLDVSQSNILGGVLEGHVILEVGGEKIGIVSALAVDTPETASPGPQVIFHDDIESLRADVAELTEAGVTKIIALTHVGVNRDMEIAEAVEGLDAIVGGHSHTLFSNTTEGAMAYPTMVGDVPVVSAYAYSKYLGHLKLTFDDEGNLKDATGDTILLDASVAEDPAVVTRVEELAGPIAETMNVVVATAAEAIDGARETCRAQECQMGNLVTDAMLDRVKHQGITIALENGGGLRASIEAGEVTMGDVVAVLPFQNTLSTFQVTGAKIVEALENGVSDVENGAGRFPQVSGMKYTVTLSAPVGSRISDVLVAEGDDFVPIDPAATYGVVSNNYLRNGGDGYAMFIDADNPYDFGPDLADVTAEYMAAQGDYTPYLDGRITVIE